ncbi:MULTISPECIES: hypothetical protein [Staphylococcus]|uniref:hypothetical protein n=1 Tax=Staphylococcus TaxID=1279 RepID=UPI00069E31EB|nr:MULTISPECIES: hypothetical protein [Staphylococcus]MBE7331240.1 hypothetical protein [Staphylococcus haemolyticus]MCE2377679.1 hypothetical protein [Staphylococcus haemolyticus]OFO70758.1 hypothetical protein HMPREF3019_08485 [Staphylococcus sp. HMSC061H04]
MSNLSIEQRAHDLALLAVDIDAKADIQNGGDVHVDLITEYVKNYKKAKDSLERISNEIPDLFS